MKRGPLFAVLVAVLTVAGPSGAQTASDRDLQALRYYIAEGDTRSVEAELRRLRLQFPDWQPPVDLNALVAAGPTREIEQIYQLIAQGDLAGARAVIEATSTQYPDWTPPSDMLRLLEATDAQTAFTSAVTAGDAPEAIMIAGNNPALLSCDRVNNAWQLAAMHLSLQDRGNAFATYRGIVRSCQGTNDLVATIEKANEIADLPELEDLFAIARQNAPQSVAAFDALETRLRAGRGLVPLAQDETAALPTPDQSRTPAPTPTPTPTPPTTAPPRSALAQAPSGASTGGGGGGTLGQVRAAAKRGAWAECLALSAGSTSASIVYERSWCAYNSDRPLEALAGFRAAESAGLGRSVQRDARFGMILSYLKRNMTEDAARLAAVTDLTHEQRLDVESQIIDQRGVRAYQRGQYRQAIAYFDALERLTGVVRRDLAMLRGYAYLKLGHRELARAEFQRLNQQLSSAETRRALRMFRD